MSVSRLDLFYRRLILTKFYTRGWGKPEELRQILEMHNIISNRSECLRAMGDVDSRVTVEKSIKSRDYTRIDGHFTSPMHTILPHLLPESCKKARFQLVLPPEEGKSQASHPVSEKIRNFGLKPVCIHMAGTGDHGFQRRRDLLAKPLLNSGISSLLLENPYYGARKPKDQTRSGLLHVKDLFIMGACLILEAQVLLNWLTQEGYGPLGLTGISMGGHMASLAATNWPKPLALVPCMSWTSSSVVWTEGVLSKSIPWRVLERQYVMDPAYETEINEIIKQNTVDSYQLGRDYVKSEGQVTPQPAPAMRGEILDKQGKVLDKDWERRRKETVTFMRGVMDQVTDLQNFSRPVDPTMVTFVIAKADAYYPTKNLRPMDQVWPGCEVRTLNTGHIAGFLLHLHDFRKAICDTFDRLIDEYNAPKQLSTGEEKSQDPHLSSVCVVPKDPPSAPSSLSLTQDFGFSTRKSTKALFLSLRSLTIKS